jgi:hypothetical protein
MVCFLFFVFFLNVSLNSCLEMRLVPESEEAAAVDSGEQVCTGESSK